MDSTSHKSREEICPNCMKEVEETNMKLHIVHCFRKITLCSRCNEPVPTTLMEEHLTVEHVSVSCERCGERMEKYRLDDHENVCKKRPASCEYCELEAPQDEIKEHETFCGARTEKCTYCEQFIMNKDGKEHPQRCPKFPRPADVGKKRHSLCVHCETEVLNDEKVRHELDCGEIMEKCVNCAHLIMNKYRRQHLQRCRNFTQSENSCEQRLFSSSHLKTDTPNNKINEHRSACSDDNPGPKNFVGGQEIQQQQHPSVTQSKNVCNKRLVSCLYCKDEISNEVIRDHLVLCGGRTGKCQDCEQEVMIRDKEEHNLMCTKTFPSEEEPFYKCKKCKEFVPASTFDDHKSMCGKIQSSKQYSKQSAKETDEVQLRCIYCKTVVSAEGKNQHETLCGERTDQCPNCEKFIKKKHQENHGMYCDQTSKYKDQPVVTCKGCSKSVKLSVFQSHKETCSGTEMVKMASPCQEITERNSKPQTSLSQPMDIDMTELKYIPLCCECEVNSAMSSDILLCDICYMVVQNMAFATSSSNNSVRANTVDEENPNFKQTKKQKKKKNNSSGRNSPTGKLVEDGRGQSIWKKLTSLSGKQNDREVNRNERTGGNSHYGMQQQNTYFREVIDPAVALEMLPCEFCLKMFCPDFLIQHESGCRPELVQCQKGDNVVAQTSGTATPSAPPIQEFFRKTAILQNDTNSTILQSQARSTAMNDHENTGNDTVQNEKFSQERITPTDGARAEMQTCKLFESVPEQRKMFCVICQKEVECTAVKYHSCGTDGLADRCQHCKEFIPTMFQKQHALKCQPSDPPSLVSSGNFFSNASSYIYTAGRGRRFNRSNDDTPLVKPGKLDESSMNSTRRPDCSPQNQRPKERVDKAVEAVTNSEVYFDSSDDEFYDAKQKDAVQDSNNCTNLSDSRKSSGRNTELPAKAPNAEPLDGRNFRAAQREVVIEHRMSTCVFCGKEVLYTASEYDRKSFEGVLLKQCPHCEELNIISAAESHASKSPKASASVNVNEERSPSSSQSKSEVRNNENKECTTCSSCDKLCPHPKHVIGDREKPRQSESYAVASALQKYTPSSSYANAVKCTSGGGRGCQTNFSSSGVQLSRRAEISADSRPSGGHIREATALASSQVQNVKYAQPQVHLFRSHREGISRGHHSNSAANTAFSVECAYNDDTAAKSTAIDSPNISASKTDSVLENTVLPQFRTLNLNDIENKSKNVTSSTRFGKGTTVNFEHNENSVKSVQEGAASQRMQTRNNGSKQGQSQIPYRGTASSFQYQRNGRMESPKDNTKRRN